MTKRKVFEGHGWARQNATLGQTPANCAVHIGRIPGRKSIALYVLRGGVMDVVAYCRTERVATLAVRALDHIILGYNRP